MFRKLDLGERTPSKITIIIDGVLSQADEGEPVAAVLLRTPPFTVRATPVSGEMRAPYCMMGVCFDCLVIIDGESSSRSCLARAREGMTVMRQANRPNPGNEVV